MIIRHCLVYEYKTKSLYPHSSPGALDFEKEKNSRKLIFSGKLVEGALSPKPMILYHSL